MAHLRNSILLVALLAVGGCTGPASPDVAPAPSASASGPASAAPAATDAAAALVAATAELRKDTFKVVMGLSVAGVMTGVVDPRTGTAELVLVSDSPGAEGTSTFRMVGGVTYANFAMKNAEGRPGLDGNGWIRMDKKQAPAGPTGSLADFDVSMLIGAAESATGVQWVDADTVRGAVPVGGTGPAVFGMTGGEPLTFEADIEPGGRLSRYAFTAKVDATASAVDFELRYSDYGTPVTVTAPPATEILNS